MKKKEEGRREREKRGSKIYKLKVFLLSGRIACPLSYNELLTTNSLNIIEYIHCRINKLEKERKNRDKVYLY